MDTWLFIVASLWMTLQINSAIAENITVEGGVHLDDEGNNGMCPSTIKVMWNEELVREPHVIKFTNETDNGTEYHYDGLFPCIHAPGISIPLSLLMLSYVDGFFDPTGVPVRVMVQLFEANIEINKEECCENAAIEYVDIDPADIVLPVILNYKESGLSSQSQVVPMLPNTGVAFVVKRADRKLLPIKILSSIFSSWPVLVLTLLLSILAGIVAWILDTRQNTEEFPMSFIQGSWEGFWWAFVSMTTVGYGDRCPRSISGRLFAIVWILTGICMCSIFTAMLTTSLTTISLDTKIPLPQAKVAALFGSIEATTGFQRQAQVIRVETIDEIKDKILEGEAVGGLMDSFTLDHYRDLFPADEFKVQEVISQEYLEYGARVSNSSLVSLVRCLKNLRFSEESEMYEFAELYMGKFMKSGIDDSMKSDEESFGVDPEGLLFYPALFTCLGILAFFLMSGATWEICRRSRLRASQRRASEKLNFLGSNGDRAHENRRTQQTKALLGEFEEKVAGDIRKALRSLRRSLNDRLLLPDHNRNSETQEKWTSV